MPVSLTMKPFLARKGASPEDVETMYSAWMKTVLLQTIRWCRPYVAAEDF